MSRRIPIDYLPTGGLNTTFNASVLQGKFLETSENADGYDIHLGLGKTPGSTRQSEQAPAGWEWIYYFEYFNLDSVLTREILGLAGDTLYRIDSNGILKFIADGFTPEPMFGVTFGNRCYITSENNDPVKWDGSTLSAWGNDAPGTQEGLVYGFQDEADWSVNAGNSKGTGSVSQSKDGSIFAQKDDATVTVVNLQQSTIDWVFVPDTRYTIWVFIPGGVLSLLAQTSEVAIQVFLSKADLITTSQFKFDIGQLFPGWNRLLLDLDNPNIINNGGIRPGDVVTTKALRYFTELAGTTQTVFGDPVRLTWDDVLSLDSGELTASLGGVGVVNDRHTYLVTFLSTSGQESNGGPISNEIDAVNQQVLLTEIPISLDPTVIARKLYRDLEGDRIYQFFAQIDDNTTVSAIDNAADPLVSAEPPLAFSATGNDNTPPPRMVATKIFESHIFGVDAENRFALVICDQGEPESARFQDRRVFDQEITNIQESPRGLILFGTDHNIIVTGRNAATFVFDDLSPKVGASGNRAATATKHFAMSWHDDGPYTHDGATTYYVGAYIKDQIVEPALDPQTFRDMHMVDMRGRLCVVFFLQSTLGGPYDTILQWQYGVSTGGTVDTYGAVDAVDPRTGSWFSTKLPVSVNPLSSAIVEQEQDRPELWVGADDGFIYRIWDPAAFDWAVSPAGNEAVDCTIETKPSSVFPNDTDRTGEPRRIYLSGETTGSAAATWDVTFLGLSGPDGKVIATKTKKVVCPLGDFEVRTPVPLGLKRIPWIKVRLENNELGRRTVFRKIRLDMTPGRYRGEQPA